MNTTWSSPPKSHGTMIPRSAAVIEAEPMFYRADAAFARANGGNIMHEFLDSIDLEHGWVIDSRTHMLMPGWLPAIPGWHHDDVPRTKPDGQPAYLSCEGEWAQEQDIQALHVMVVIDAVDAPTGSMTEFVCGDLPVCHPYDFQPERAVYAKWNDAINATGSGDRWVVTSNQIVEFNSTSMHRAMPATSTGWRHFIRATTHASYPAENKIRRNANVYLPAPEEGW